MILHADAPLPHAEVHLEVVQQAFAALKDRRRALAGRTGCGVCGIESIDLLDLAPERVPDTGFLARLAPDALTRAAQALPVHQALTRLTGGCMRPRGATQQARSRWHSRTSAATTHSTS